MENELTDNEIYQLMSTLQIIWQNYLEANEDAEDKVIYINLIENIDF